METLTSQVFPKFVQQDPANEGLFIARDKVWRTARQVLSPSFSSSKMKAVCHCRDVSKFTIRCVCACGWVGGRAGVCVVLNDIFLFHMLCTVSIV